MCVCVCVCARAHAACAQERKRREGARGGTEEEKETEILAWRVWVRALVHNNLVILTGHVCAHYVGASPVQVGPAVYDNCRLCNAATRWQGLKLPPVSIAQGIFGDMGL